MSLSITTPKRAYDQKSWFVKLDCVVFVLFWFSAFYFVLVLDKFFLLNLDAYLSPDIRYEGDVIVPAVNFGLFFVAG